MSENLTENHSCSSEQSSGEKTPKVSVIVPVYKVEKYLPECIDSILAQTFTDFELILVDDGSPDNSGKICDDYAARDSRIRVFHKENGGVTSARRLGVENAKGEWVMFVDSDDTVPADALKFLYENVGEFGVDLIEGDSLYLGTSVNFGRVGGRMSFTASSLEYAHELASHRMLWKTAPWGKIIRRSKLIESGGMNAPAWMVMGEDLFMLLCISCVSRKYVRVSANVYNYRTNPQGACGTFIPTVRYFELWFREVEKKIGTMSKEWNIVLDTLLCCRYGSLFLFASDFSLDDEFVRNIVMRVRGCPQIGMTSKICLWLSPILPHRVCKILVGALLCWGRALNRMVR